MERTRKIGAGCHTISDNEKTPTRIPSKYGFPRSAPTQAIRDMMMSFQASRQPGRNKDNGLKRLEKTFSGNFEGLPRDNRIQEVLAMTRKFPSKWTTDKYSDISIPLIDAIEPGGFRMRLDRGKSKCKPYHSNSGEIVTVKKSRVAKSGRRKRSRTRGRKRVTVDKDGYVPIRKQSMKMKARQSKVLKVVRRNIQSKILQESKLDVHPTPANRPENKYDQKFVSIWDWNSGPAWDDINETDRSLKPVLLDKNMMAKLNLLLMTNFPTPVQKAHVLDFSRGKIRVGDAVSRMPGSNISEKIGGVTTNSNPAKNASDLNAPSASHRDPPGMSSSLTPSSPSPKKTAEKIAKSSKASYSNKNSTKTESGSKNGHFAKTTKTRTVKVKKLKQIPEIIAAVKESTVTQRGMAIDKIDPSSKISLVKRISQTAQSWLSKKFSRSKSDPEKADDPLPTQRVPVPSLQPQAILPLQPPPQLTPVQLPPQPQSRLPPRVQPLVPERPRRRRITVQEAIENSERIRLGLGLQMNEDPNRPATGRSVERAEAVLDITHVPVPSVEVVRVCDPGIEITSPARTSVLKRFLSSHNVNRPPRPVDTTTTAVQFGTPPVSNASIDKKGVLGRLMDRVKSVRSKQNRVAPMR